MMYRRLANVLPILMLSACHNSPQNAQPAASASAVAINDDALDQANIPVKEDYEELARQAITADNLDTELSKLEQQITTDHS